MGRRPSAPRTSSSRGTIADVLALLGDFANAVAVSRSRAGMPRVRPITLENPVEVPGSDLWFVTSREAEGHGGIESGSTIGICCYGAEGGGWLSLAAVAHVDEDHLAIHRLWKPDWREQLPGGPDDPDLVLVRLDLLRAEHWDPVPGHLRVVYEVVSGTRSTSEGAHP